MQIRPGALMFYDMSFYNYTGQRRISDKAINHESPSAKYTGKLTEKAKSKLRFSINLLVEQAKWKEVQNPTTKRFYRFKVNFITLTLSGKQRDVSDKTIKSKLLFPFIRNMRNVYSLRSYVWRAERQRNGNIHFHLTTDTYIPYDAIRDAWNFQQAKYHFIDEFKSRYNSEFPNSTDVHSVQNIKNLASYLVKYMSKDEKNLDTIEGKVWDCSTNLKTKERVIFEMQISDFNLLSRLKEQYEDRFKSNDFCSILPLSRSEMSRLLPGEYWSKYNAWLQSIYDAATPPRAKILNL